MKCSYQTTLIYTHSTYCYCKAKLSELFGYPDWLDISASATTFNSTFFLQNSKPFNVLLGVYIQC